LWITARAPVRAVICLQGDFSRQVCAMTPDYIDDLFAKTLFGDYEDDAPWHAVHELRRIGSREVFDKAAEWCRSREALVRTRGLDVVAQIGRTPEHPSNSFPEESFSVVSKVLEDEKEVQPLDSAIAALGHLNNSSGIPLIIQYQSHPDSNVRFSVACALGSYSNDPRSAECMLLLMRDADAEVRDWATFGLGVQGDLDSVEIRDALFTRLSDSNEDVREEAMAGLAKRRDRRVVPSLVAVLAELTASHRVIEAACDLLDMQTDCGDWSSEDYASALRERFGI
jgi:HEAT repeat protein